MNYLIKGLLLTLFIVVLYIYLNFYRVFSIYNCLTTDFLWKIFNNKLVECTRSKPQTCREVSPYGTYGFCYDLDYYGVAMGQKEGPYGFQCDDWVFDKRDCYPETCELANTSKRFGWCLDRDKNRAYLGNSCGPNETYGIQCENWIWSSPDKCPKECPPKLKKKTVKKQKIPKILKCPIKKDRCIC